MANHLSHEEFFVKLGAELDYRKTRDHGRIYLTQKRMTYGHGADQALGAGSVQLFPLIVRATNGKKKGCKVKISTIVAPVDIEAFFARYLEVCKTGMVALRPRDKTKKKEKAKARKKRVAPGAVVPRT